MAKVRKYVPNNKYNPVIQSKKIEETRIELIKLKQTINLITESNEKHYQLLGNFARHDIKNILINFNSIIDLYKDSLNNEVIESMQLNIESLSAVIANLSKLIPHSDSTKFKFCELFTAVRILITPIIDSLKIKCTLDYDNDNQAEINLPFQAVLQMVNNLVVNSLKALEDVVGEKFIFINSEITDNCLSIKISDNGCEIPETNKDKVFEFAFTTTGGSGIGLNHAKFLCEKFNGKITLILEKEKEINKLFHILIPLS